MGKNPEPHFYHYLAEGNIICDVESEKSSDVIKELVQTLVKNNASLDLDETVDAVLAREKLMPTVIAPGLAVPHARLSNIKQLLVAFGTSSKGIEFNAPGMPPVNVSILILTPKDDPGLHLQILAALGKDFIDPETPAKIASMSSPSEIMNFFTGTSAEIPKFLTASNLMNKKPVVMNEADSLAKAIETFATKQIMDIPIVDEENDVRGVISVEDILKFSLPEHLLWLNDLSPILHFQPFAEMLKNDKETKIADCMREQFVSVDENLPAIQLAKIFLVDNVRRIIVTRKGKFAGVVDVQDFTTKLFWA